MNTEDEIKQFAADIVEENKQKLQQMFDNKEK